jgi:formylmethanofuran dehydrogenase subunit E
MLQSNYQAGIIMDKIRSLTYEEYASRIREFHGNLAPGVVLAGFMVDYACRHLPEGTLFDAICETTACLPDAVQLLTPCSIGNQWMKIIDVGRYALTLYDKYTGEGVRVFLDHRKMDRWPAIKAWYLKQKPKQEQDRQNLTEQIKEAGTGIFGLEKIRVSPDYMRKLSKTIAICPVCHEAYRAEDGKTCPACQGGKLPYRTSDKFEPSGSK